MALASSTLIRGMIIPNGGPLHFDVSQLFDSPGEFQVETSDGENVIVTVEDKMTNVSLVNPLRVGRTHLHVSDGSTTIDTDVTILPEPSIHLDVSVREDSFEQGIDVSSVFDMFSMLSNPYMTRVGTFEIKQGGLFFTPALHAGGHRAYAMIYGEKNGSIIVAQVRVRVTSGFGL